MKKQILIPVLAFFAMCLVSCSSDNDPTTSVNSLSLTVNGDVVVFSANEISVQSVPNGGIDGGPITIINASVNNLNNEVVSIAIKEGVTGSSSLEAFEYSNAASNLTISHVPSVGVIGVACGNNLMDTVNFVTNTNSSSALSGSFSLMVQSCENGTIVTNTISDGSFSVTF